MEACRVRIMVTGLPWASRTEVQRDSGWKRGQGDDVGETEPVFNGRRCRVRPQRRAVAESELEAQMAAARRTEGREKNWQC